MKKKGKFLKIFFTHEKMGATRLMCKGPIPTKIPYTNKKLVPICSAPYWP